MSCRVYGTSSTDFQSWVFVSDCWVYSLSNYVFSVLYFLSRTASFCLISEMNKHHVCNSQSKWDQKCISYMYASLVIRYHTIFFLKYSPMVGDQKGRDFASLTAYWLFWEYAILHYTQNLLRISMLSKTGPWCVNLLFHYGQERQSSPCATLMEPVGQDCCTHFSQDSSPR